MSDIENGLTTLDILQLQHRKEKKELQAKISKLKKSINKDKKRKKEVSEQIVILEEDLLARQNEELSSIQDKKSVSICDQLNDVHIETNDKLVEESTIIKDKKITKAEKRRNKKAEDARERENRIKEGEKSSSNCERKIETEKLTQKLKERGLEMHEVNSDGDCLFAAISHQLDCSHSVQNLRSLAVSLIRDRKEDFAPFLIDSETGDLLSDEQFESYCHQMSSSAVWGGQPELRALSQSLQRKIEVIQAEGTPVVFGDEFTDQTPILLPYYRHFCELGEHYNSVLPLEKHVVA